MILDITNNKNKKDLLNTVVYHEFGIHDLVTAIMYIDDTPIACGHIDKNLNTTIYFKKDETKERKEEMERFLFSSAKISYS